MASKDSPLISIVVPVYNIEKYIARCIKSILNQTYDNLEIILVDDGSTDNSARICKSLQNVDPRIIVLSQKNTGLSAARNTGISYSHGEYISFIDGDDYISANFVKEMFESLIANKADIAVCSILNVDDTGKAVGISTKLNDAVLTNEEVFNKIVANESKAWTIISACNKIFKKNLFDNIKFPEGKLNEDAFIAYPLFASADRICFLKNYLYYYVQRESSIMHSSISVKNLDRLEASYCQFKFCIENGHTNCLEAIRKTASENCYIFFRLNLRHLNRSDRDRIKSVLQMLNEMDICPLNTQLLKSIFYKLYIKILKHDK